MYQLKCVAHVLINQLYLVSPLIDDGHVDVVHKHRHPPAPRRAVRAAHTLVHVALDGTLEHHRC